ncbi:MAG: DUF4336 domain-containing protein [Myxococcales bacterium]|nr:DUF4336 domain-containing protein [Myxococcales bacterium]
MNTSSRADASLRPFGPNLWFHDAWVRFLGMPLKTRMTVVRLSDQPDAPLWLHSPIGDAPALRSRLDALGTVRHLVAPNAIHHLGLRDFANEFPDATIWATKNVEARSRIRAHASLEGPPERDTTPARWGADLELCVLGGNLLLEEALVLHRPSRTLIVTDFVEKIDESCTSPRAARLFGWFGLTTGEPAPAPEHRVFAVDPAPLRAAKERVLAWDFDRMIIAHGPNVEQHAKDELARCFDAAIRAASGRGERRGPVSVALRRLCLRLAPG